MQQQQILDTRGYAGFAVQFSPLDSDRLAVAASSNYGIVGNGRLLIFDLNAPPGSAPLIYDTQDSLFDCCWSESRPGQLVSAGGDGSIQMWDTSLPTGGLPIARWKEHEREVFSVCWNLVSRQSFLSSSWDGSVKLWDPSRKTSLRTWSSASEGCGCVYSTAWNARNPNVFVSGSSDGFLRVWDTLQSQTICQIPAHGNEILSVDFNKYQDHLVYTASSDSTIRAWDLRNPSRFVNVMMGHQLGVRRIKAFPFSPDLVASCGYDMSVRVWDTRLNPAQTVQPAAEGSFGLLFMGSKDYPVAAKVSAHKATGVYAQVNPLR